MGSNSIKSALKEIETRRQRALFTASMREAEVCEKLPRVRELTIQLSQTCELLSKVVFSDNKEDKKAQIEAIMRKNLFYQHQLDDILQTNGYPVDYLEIYYICKSCDDTGYVLGKQCDCLKRLIVEQNIAEFNQNSLISTEQTFDNFSLDFYSNEAINENGVSNRMIMRDILSNCRAYAEQFSKQAKSILMVGGTGLGKTHLSVSIANVIMKKGFTVLYLSAPDIFRKLQNEYYGKGEQGVDTMDIIQKSDLVILDDLGAEIENQFAGSSLYNIINSRLNRNKPTIISTNLSLKQMESRYSDRVASRLITVYRCLKFVGKDIRQLKLKV